MLDPQAQAADLRSKGKLVWGSESELLSKGGPPFGTREAFLDAISLWLPCPLR